MSSLLFSGFFFVHQTQPDQETNDFVFLQLCQVLFAHLESTLKCADDLQPRRPVFFALLELFFQPLIVLEPGRPVFFALLELFFQPLIVFRAARSLRSP